MKVYKRDWMRKQRAGIDSIHGVDRRMTTVQLREDKLKKLGKCQSCELLLTSKFSCEVCVKLK